MKPAFKNIITGLILSLYLAGNAGSQDIPGEFIDPPREFSLMPFWFWNDTLRDEEIVRQIADFEKHGVYGFVIHPRIGLPENLGWLSPEMIRLMRIAIEEASGRGMYVILYDEGMYPSGSASGQVVAQNPKHAARGLAKIDLQPGEDLNLPDGASLIATLARPGGVRLAIVEKPSGGIIRGIHYIGEGGKKLQEESPPAGDILNPEAVASFINLVYERYAKEFGSYFGTTIPGIFTDEPSPLGRDSEKGLIPGNAAMLKQINNFLGYDFTPYLADLWYDDLPGSVKHRKDYYRAVNACLEENYYKPLGNWCHVHGISLMGHPAGSMDIGPERYFQVPGQDLVWRYVEPGPKALEGQHSTTAKCASSAMANLGHRRNSNELYGAYGHNLTFGEMEWLAEWCLVRGQNLLFPHAFYYSIRGPRFDERPPDVGPNSGWWDNYKLFADACRRLCWLNTDSKQVCNVAILCESDWLPDKFAKACYTNQRDFNYLEMRNLWEDSEVDKTGLHIAGMDYRAIIIDSLSSVPSRAIPFLKKLAEDSRLIIRKSSQFKEMLKGAVTIDTDDELIAATDKLIQPDALLDPPTRNIRLRHIIKHNDHYYIFFNEDESEVNAKIHLPVRGDSQWLNPFTAEALNVPEEEPVHFSPYELKILRVHSKD
jgi:hypothetical protein